MNKIDFEKRFFDMDSQKSKAVVINGKTVLVRQSPLTRLEATIFVDTVCDMFQKKYLTYGEVIDKEWIIRLSTIYLYTTATDVFNLDNKENTSENSKEIDAELDMFNEIMYGTPLYAMLVGAPQNPKYFEGIPFTTPLIDIDQYNGILQAIDDTLESRIYLWKVAQKNENT